MVKNEIVGNEEELPEQISKPRGRPSKHL
jgi:hypothetical protein